MIAKITLLETGEISLLVSFVFFAASIIVAVIMGYIPNKRKHEIKVLKEKLKSRNNELLAVYQDVQALIQIEDYICKESSITKQEARKGYTISNRCEPKRIEKRIVELERQMNS